MQQLKVQQLMSVYLSQVRALLSNSQHGVFSKPLFDAFWSLAATQKWELWQLSHLLESSLRFGYFTTRDGKMLRDIIIERQDEISTSDGISILSMAEGMALLAAQDLHALEDPRTRQVGNILGSATDKINILHSFPIKFVNFMWNLAALGTFPKEQLDVLFSPEFQAGSLSRVPYRRKDGFLRQLLDIEQCVRLRLGEESSSAFRLEPTVRELAIRSAGRQVVRYEPLERSLATAFGGEQFLVRGVTTPLGSYVDAVVAMRQGEYPISLQNDSTNPEGSNTSKPFEELPADSKVVAIIFANRFNYLQATGLPKVRSK